MAATAEAYGFGARAPYATPRASDYDMKERVRLSGLFPRVRNEPLSKQLQALLKEFEQNAALTGILERRRRLEERLRHELRGTEGMDALHRSVAPPWLASADAAKASADVDAAYRADRAAAAAPVRELNSYGDLRAAYKATAKAAAASATAANVAAANAAAATFFVYERAAKEDWQRQWMIDHPSESSGGVPEPNFAPISTPSSNPSPWSPPPSPGSD